MEITVSNRLIARTYKEAQQAMIDELLEKNFEIVGSANLRVRDYIYGGDGVVLKTWSYEAEVWFKD